MLGLQDLEGLRPALRLEACHSPALLALVGALGVEAHAQRQALVAFVHLDEGQRMSRVFPLSVLQPQPQAWFRVQNFSISLRALRELGWSTFNSAYEWVLRDCKTRFG